MKKLCFATNNKHKIAEVSQMLDGQYELLSLEDIGCHVELPEEQDTLEGNSHQKAAYVWDNFAVSCFADDTGLEVEALDGAPGVYSARYAGPQRSDTDNIQKLLQSLEGQANRRARFRTSITLILEGKEHQFEGIVTGSIAEDWKGDKGFGYDPVFVPDDHDRTFAQMRPEEKNAISHRGRAVQQLVGFLKAL
ncbi:non-canonical purine NTP diphosphatase [Pontibacter akesuensis]|uniref:dITP/XTP pyrophosphatase n=1 Tax=Pontibacter akesuensis TaxID=388950 RepID=A0A1I7JEM9_9BACT|nr:non-canonical purine NTP diphosphatase [Pontibacter akesuensis]GHA70499.1 non-canonical purine NTP pyrophosphatase [Pontibacter akesuensis]SFU83620.1 XTP/dITP diphosphohydrolase [Pontibacter akesuensis]